MPSGKDNKPADKPADKPAKQWARKNRNVLIIGGIALIGLAAAAVAWRAAPGEFRPLALVIFIPFAIALPLLAYLLFVRRISPQRFFVVAALLLGLLMMLVRTPYAWFDENTHVYLSIYYSDVALGAPHEYQPDGSFTWTARADSDNAQGFSEHLTTAEDYRLLSEHFFEGERYPGETSVLEVSDVGVFYQYLPTILGVTLGQVLQLGIVPTLYLGRLCSLIVFILMLSLAIRLAPQRFKVLFVLLGLVPLTLASGGTFSYDNVLNELSFVFIASVLHLAYAERSLGIRDLVFISIIALLIIPLKHVYFPLVFLVLLIPTEKWPRPFVKSLWCAAAGVIVMVVTGIFAYGHLAYDATQTLQNQQVAVPSAETRNYTIGSFFADPLTGTIVYLRSLLHDLGLFADLPAGFGFSEKLPVWFYYLMLLMLVLSAASSPSKEEKSFTVGQRLIMGALALIIYGFVVASGITSTPVGNQLIAGVQGRYLIPLVPLVVLAVSGSIRAPFETGRAFLFAFCCIDALSIFLQFMSVV